MASDIARCWDGWEGGRGGEPSEKSVVKKTLLIMEQLRIIWKVLQIYLLKILVLHEICIFYESGRNAELFFQQDKFIQNQGLPISLICQPITKSYHLSFISPFFLISLPLVHYLPTVVNYSHSHFILVQCLN